MAPYSSGGFQLGSTSEYWVAVCPNGMAAAPDAPGGMVAALGMVAAPGMVPAASPNGGDRTAPERHRGRVVAT